MVLQNRFFGLCRQKEPLRIFYESLSKQIPPSEMAEFWLMQHGLLPSERAKKAFDKKQRRQKELRTGTPVKTETSQKVQASKNGDIKAKKLKNVESDDNDDDDDDDSIRKSSGNLQLLDQDILKCF
ncbi:uncharacterized protein LOC130734467 [Lotus japonicus]|uniref:uncharacterized protein LOC130734467 n=1 Tax=Lotus japonicus TaxID=34305 RepID=UPI002590B652|nr:uncharacterized protein LOC130734467 [Lotus japonicus]